VLSETALQQINDKKYETELTAAGVKTVYKYGVAFSGKKSPSRRARELLCIFRRYDSNTLLCGSHPRF